MSRYLGLMGICALLLWPLSCAPTYPKCDRDEHCKEAEYCVNGLCQQCRQTADCSRGQTCTQGRCEAIVGYCTSAGDCPQGQLCRDNRCAPCKSDSDCEENQECQQGRCVSPPQPMQASGPCSPQTVYFAFNESVLSPDAVETLQQAVKCIRSASDRRVRLEGHCDPRGTEEYNLALGDARARSVQRYLTRMGIDQKRFRIVSKGELEATGTEETSWFRDRKVAPIWE